MNARARTSIGSIAELRFLCVWALFVFLSLPQLSCGNAGDGTNQNGTVKYYLEADATASLSNVLILEADGEFKPTFSLSGSGFESDFVFDEAQTFQERTPIRAATFGEATITITLYQENGKPYLTDSLSWKSSEEIPPVPKPYFSEIVSNDDYVYLVFPPSRGKNVKEVWIAGTGVAPASGKYYEIPRDEQVLVQLSAGDGIKAMTVKYRNIYGSEGPSVELGIQKKSQGPQNCLVKTAATKTANGLIRTRIQAVNDGPLYYKITGDVETLRDFVEFTDRLEEYVALSAGEGVKNLTVKVKDQAGNNCPDTKLSITYDRNYKPGAVKVKDDKIWTDDPAISIIPSFDFLEGDNISIFVSGGILDDENTFDWIPYTEEMLVRLTPVDGTRHIFVQFKREDTVVVEATVPIYLQPFVQVIGSAPSQTLSVSNIVGMTSLSIVGCSETYQNVSYQSSFICTKAAAEVTVTYLLKDGTTVSRSAPL